MSGDPYQRAHAALRKGIQDYLNGNYDTARKNDKCKHGRYGFEGCENCIDEHFMKLLNRTVYGAAFRRYGKSLRVLPVLEKGEVRARALRPWECGASGRWHIHCAIELPSHFDAITLEKMIRACWAKVEWGHGRILVRDGANAGWIDYMLKDRQKSEFDGFLDCIIIESLHNPIADA
jgi:hypothetical protein